MGSPAAPRPGARATHLRLPDPTPLLPPPLCLSPQPLALGRPTCLPGRALSSCASPVTKPCRVPRTLPFWAAPSGEFPAPWALSASQPFAPTHLVPGLVGVWASQSPLPTEPRCPTSLTSPSQCSRLARLSARLSPQDRLLSSPDQGPSSCESQAPPSPGAPNCSTSPSRVPLARPHLSPLCPVLPLPRARTPSF